MLIVSPDMRIDLHQHLLPEQLIDALRRRTVPPAIEGRNGATVLRLAHEPDGEIDLSPHRPDVRLAALAEAGVDLAVVSLSSPLGIEALPAREAGELIAAYHDDLAEISASAGGRIAAWAAAPLAEDDAGASTVAGALDRGFVGASLPSAALASRDDIDRVAPLLDLLERRGAPLFVHPGPAPGTPPYARVEGMPDWWPNLGAYPGLSISAFFSWRAAGSARWPRLRVCFAIMAGAGPFLEERWRTFSGERGAIDRNVFLDTASCGRLALECALATYGVEQVVFGTDIPVIGAGRVGRALAELGPAVVEAVTASNPLRLLEPRE
jgi:predicted TIM-barrel fold metal-dependent hydrolase